MGHLTTMDEAIQLLVRLKEKLERDATGDLRGATADLERVIAFLSDTAAGLIRPRNKSYDVK
jgi:hypothetical protein